MISFFVGSNKYSWGIPYEYLPGRGNLSGKIISIKCNHESNLGFIFKQQFPFSHVLRLFQDNFNFGEATSPLFFRLTTSTEQLHFWSSSFFLLFQNTHFFAAVIFSEKLLFQSENSTEQPLLENKKFLIAVTFRNSCLFFLFRIKRPKRELLFQSRYFCTVSIFLENLHFGKS